MAKISDWNCIHLSDDRPPMPLERGRLKAGGRFVPEHGQNGRQSHEPAPLLALIPADRCNVISVDLPEIGGRKLEQALRWAAEDIIAGPVEDQHVAPVQREADGRLRCIVCSKKDMQQWLNALPDRPHRIVPDAACLPWQPGQITLMQHERHWLLRWSDTGFDRVEPELLELTLPELLEDAAGSVQLVCYRTSGDRPLPDALKTLELEQRTLETAPLALLSGQAVESPVNLMHGDYSPVEPGRHRKRWQLAAILAATAALLLVVNSAGENWLLARKAEQLDQEISRQFQQIFPEITRVQRPRVQAEQAMTLMAGGGSDIFVGLASRISEVLSGAAGIRVETLNYAAGQISLSLNVPGTDDLEALQRQLRAQGLNVSVENLQILPEGPQARLTIRAGAP